jgi:hypothetical protein
MAEDTVTLIAPNGVQVGVGASKKAGLLVNGYRVPDDRSSSKYDDLKAADLKAKIEARNADREDGAKLSTAGNKAALIAALVADDAAPPVSDN